MRLGNYLLTESIIGQGKFGQVLKGIHRKTGDAVAIKLEPVDSEIRVLKHETSILNYLYSKSCRNIPPVLFYGKSDHFTYLVIPFYDTPLSSMLREAAFYSKFLRSAVQILEHVHDLSILHRDIKPDNWMIRGNELVLIDFGMATSEASYPGPEKTHIVGTPKYASIHVHHGAEYSRRDDLISAVYIAWGLFQGTFDIWGPVSHKPHPLPLNHRLHPTNLWLLDQKGEIPDSAPLDLRLYWQRLYSLAWFETDYAFGQENHINTP